MEGITDPKTRQRLRAVVEPIVASLGLRLWGLEVTASGRRGLVRIYVEAPEGAATPPDSVLEDQGEAAQGGVTIDQCAQVSRHVGTALEVEDVVHGSYVLEVSSPGLERPFFSPGQMEAFTGQEVDVQLETPLPGFGTRRKFRGPLQEVAGDVLRVEVDGQVAELPWDRVKKAKLVHRFEEPAKPGKKKKKK